MGKQKIDQEGRICPEKWKRTFSLWKGRVFLCVLICTQNVSVSKEHFSVPRDHFSFAQPTSLNYVMLPAWNAVGLGSVRSWIRAMQVESKKVIQIHVTCPEYSIYLLLFPNTNVRSPTISEPRSSRVLQHCQVGSSSRQVEQWTRTCEAETMVEAWE